MLRKIMGLIGIVMFFVFLISTSYFYNKVFYEGLEEKTLIEEQYIKTKINNVNVCYNEALEMWTECGEFTPYED